MKNNHLKILFLLLATLTFAYAFGCSGDEGLMPRPECAEGQELQNSVCVQIAAAACPEGQVQSESGCIEQPIEQPKEKFLALTKATILSFDGREQLIGTSEVVMTFNSGDQVEKITYTTRTGTAEAVLSYNADGRVEKFSMPLTEEQVMNIAFTYSDKGMVTSIVHSFNATDNAKTDYEYKSDGSRVGKHFKFNNGGWVVDNDYRQDMAVFNNNNLPTSTTLCRPALCTTYTYSYGEDSRLLGYNVSFGSELQQLQVHYDDAGRPDSSEMTRNTAGRDTIPVRKVQGTYENGRLTNETVWEWMDNKYVKKIERKFEYKETETSPSPYMPFIIGLLQMGPGTTLLYLDRPDIFFGKECLLF